MSLESPVPPLLEGVTVLEIGIGLPSALCGRILVDLGARVIKLEESAGDWTAEFEPKSADGRSQTYHIVNAGKEIVRTDSTDEYTQRLESLAAEVDAVIEHPESHVGGGPPAQLPSGDGLVRCFIHDDADESGVRLGETGAQAVAGLAGHLGTIGRKPDAKPRTVRADVAATATAVFAAQGILAGLIGKTATELGTDVTVSTVRALGAIKTLIWAARHAPDEWRGFHCNAETGPEQLAYHASDGPITFDLSGMSLDGYQTLADKLGLELELGDLNPADIAAFGDHAAEFREVIERALANRTEVEIGDLLQEVNGISVPYVLLSAVRDSAHITVLDPFRSVPEMECERVLTPIRWDWLDERAGDEPATVDGHETNEPAAVDGGHGPLTGVNVIDLGIGGVGPWGATLLAQLGATVKKVESPAGDTILHVWPEQNGFRTTYAALNLGKDAVAIDLKDGEARSLFESVVGDADILTQNFRPGVMERLGLSDARLAELNPRLILFGSSGYGPDGPYAGRRATDAHVQAVSGFAAANGRHDEPEALRYNGFVDLLTSSFNCLAMLAGLLFQRRCGVGARIDTTMLGTALFAEQIALASVTDGTIEPPDPSERSEYTPAGAYRTQDGWIALEVRNESEWRGLGQALGLTPDGVAQFDTNRARCQHRDAIREALESVLTAHPTQRWISALSRNGVPCGRFISDDWNMSQDGPTSIVTHTIGDGLGHMRAGCLPWEFSAYCCEVGTAPSPGEHTDSLPESLSFSWHGRTERTVSLTPR